MTCIDVDAILVPFFVPLGIGISMTYGDDSLPLPPFLVGGIGSLIVGAAFESDFFAGTAG